MVPIPGPLAAIQPSEYGSAPLRGVLLANVPEAEQNPDGYLSIITGQSTGTGRWISNLLNPPNVTESDTRVNPFESLYGKTAPVVGEDQIQSVQHEVTASLTSLTLENLKLMRPDMSFAVKMAADGTTPIGVTMKRTLQSGPSYHLTNLVIAYSTSTHTIGRDVILGNPMAVTEERTYELSEDLEVFGVEVTWRAFSTGADMDLETGVLLPSFSETDYTVTAIPAGL